MKITLFTLLFIFTAFVLQGQAPSLDWVKSLGGTGYDYGNGICLDNNNNMYVTGIFGSTTDFDPGPNQYNLSPIGAQDIFLLKLDNNGNFLWAVRFGGGTPSISYNDSGHDLVVDNQGNILLTGLYKGTSDFDPGIGIFNLSSNNGEADVFVVKLNGNGGFIWAKGFGGVVMEEITSIDVDGNDNIYLSGSFFGNTDFDPGVGTFFMTATLPYSNGTFSITEELFQLKLNSNGDFLWANKAGDYSTDISFSKVDNQGNIYSTGSFVGSVDFDPGPNSVVLTTASYVPNIFLRKQDTNGNLLWVKGLSGGFSQGNSIDIDQNGNIYISGNFQSTVDFDPGVTIYSMTSTGQKDAFISKFDINGNFIWANQLGSTNGLSEQFISLTVDNDNNIIAIGQSLSTLNNIDFNPGPAIYTLSGAGPYLIKYNENGSLMWVVNPVATQNLNSAFLGQGNGSSGNNGGYCLKEKNNSIYLTGGFNRTADFNPGIQSDSLISMGNANPTDIFIQKLNTCSSSTTTFTTSSCSSYTAPDGQVFTQSGQYTSTLTNAAGCDSIVTINLTIHQPSASSITESACKEYTAPDGQVYTQSGTYTSVIPTASGCDSTITIALTINSIVAGIAQNGIELSSTTNNAQYQWIRCENNQAIAGATGQLYTASANGQYAVVVSQNNCSDTSACVTVSTVGLDEFNLENVIPYPNPTHGFIQLSIDASLIDQLIVTNLLGEIMHTSENVNTLNVSQLDAGIYEIIMFFNGQKNFLRFVKLD
jgi:hypothetical protein